VVRGVLEGGGGGGGEGGIFFFGGGGGGGESREPCLTGGKNKELLPQNWLMGSTVQRHLPVCYLAPTE